jgi:hypothetical protein
MKWVFDNQTAVVTIGIEPPRGAKLDSCIKPQRGDSGCRVTRDWNPEKVCSMGMTVVWIGRNKVRRRKISVFVCVVSASPIDVVHYPLECARAIDLNEALCDRHKLRSDEHAVLNVIRAIGLVRDQVNEIALKSISRRRYISYLVVWARGGLPSP